jgi:hypothetical protein
MLLDNPFTCSNGHSFTANAKLRARCPECGVPAKRDFKATAPKVDDPKPEPIVESKTDPIVPVVKKPVLLKQGRPRVLMAAKRKPAVVAKRSTTVIPRSKGTTSAGLVKSSKIKSRGTMPTIKARPIKTAVARGIQEHGSSRGTRPFWHDVADKYGI